MDRPRRIIPPPNDRRWFVPPGTDLSGQFVINMFIEEYSHGSFYNHNSRRERKLLLNTQELKKLQKQVQNYEMKPNDPRKSVD